MLSYGEICDIGGEVSGWRECIGEMSVGICLGGGGGGAVKSRGGECRDTKNQFSSIRKTHTINVCYTEFSTVVEVFINNSIRFQY